VAGEGRGTRAGKRCHPAELAGSGLAAGGAATEGVGPREGGMASRDSLENPPQTPSQDPWKTKFHLVEIWAGHSN